MLRNTSPVKGFSGGNLLPQARGDEEGVVSSTTYQLFRAAMAGRKQVVCSYDGHERELCPIILGHSEDGQEKALTFQFAGGSRSGLPRAGEWRCLWLGRVTEVRLRDGKWHAGAEHRRAQACVEVVDIDVNPASPYKPARRL